MFSGFIENYSSPRNLVSLNVATIRNVLVKFSLEKTSGLTPFRDGVAGGEIMFHLFL